MACLCKSFHKHYICGQEFSSEIFSCANQHLVYVWKFYHMLDTLYVCQNPGFQSWFPFQHLNMVVCHLPFFCFLPSNTFWNPKEIAWCWNWNIWLNFLRVVGWLRDLFCRSTGFLDWQKWKWDAKAWVRGISVFLVSIAWLANCLWPNLCFLFEERKRRNLRPSPWWHLWFSAQGHQNERYREKLCAFGEFLVFDSNPCYVGEHNLVKILPPKSQRQKRHHRVAV